MFVLGIDPGLTRCGYGAVRQEDGKPVAVVSGVLTTPTSNPLAERLAELLREFRLLFARLSPEVVVVERVLFQTNARTAMSVGQASGLALATAAEAGIPVVQYSPNEVKQAVTGWGNAGKDQVQRMVQVLLDMPEKPSPPDIADALALALCHLASAPLMRAAAAAASTSTTSAPLMRPAAARRGGASPIAQRAGIGPKTMPRLEQAGPGEVPAAVGGRR
jgi:crossover junction endodeoxyribonuclease RuvC